MTERNSDEVKKLSKTDLTGTHLFCKLESKEFRTLAEWYLLSKDLKNCLKTAETLKTFLTTQDKQGVSGSLFRDTVVRFVACFDKGTPVHLVAEDIFKDYSNGMEFYRWIKDLRDFCIAHRTGSGKHTSFGVIVHGRTGKLLGFGSQVVSHSHECPENADCLVRAIGLALSYVEKQIHSLEPIVIAQVKEMPSHSRLRLPIAGIKSPSPDELRMGRRKYDNLNKLLRRDIPRTLSDNSQGNNE